MAVTQAGIGVPSPPRPSPAANHSAPATAFGGRATRGTLGHECLGQRRPDAVADGRAVRPDGLLRNPGDRLGEGDSALPGLAPGDESDDRTPALGGLGVHGSAGEKYVERATASDHARGMWGHAVPEQHAEPSSEAAELRGLGRHPDVTLQ